MRWLRIARLRLRSLFRRTLVDDDVHDELQAYLDQRIEQAVAAGSSPDDARVAARRELGSMMRVKEECRDARRINAVDDFTQDVRYGARLLRRNPLFALTAALSLAVCIGANATIFTVANRLLFGDPAGVVDPDRLVDISPTTTGRIFAEPLVSFADYVEIGRRATLLDGVYGYQIELRPMSLAGPDGAERVFGTFATTNYFSVLGVRPAAGRLFARVDSDEAGASPIVVLSHSFWTRRFNADPHIVGQKIELTRQPFTVVGVAPERFKGLSLLVPDVWIPVGMAGALGESGTTRLADANERLLIVGGRLRPGVAVPRAAAEMDALGRALARERGRDTPDDASLERGGPVAGMVERRGAWGLRLGRWTPIPRILLLPVAGFVTLLLALVSLVLVIACANVAGVLLARATTRRREIAVRLAIGAGRARLIRQLLTETLLLFFLGGAAGLLLARVMTSLLVSQLPSLPVPVDVSLPLDLRIVLFTAGLSLAAALAAGLVPALQTSRADVVSALKDDAQAPPDRMRLRSAFVVAQVAFSLLLVVGAGLFVRALQKTTTIGGAFDPAGVEVVSLDLSLAGYTKATGPVFARELADRVRQLPGVEAATVAYLLPHGGREMFCCGVTVPGATPPHGQPVFMPTWNTVEPGYFATLHLPIVAGRDFEAADRDSAQPVAIVDDSTARRLWPGQSALGRYLLWQTGSGLFALNGPRTPSPVKQLVVVGVVRSLDVGRRGDEAPLAVYLPLQQEYRPRLSLLARATHGQRLAREIRSVLASMNPGLPILSSSSLADQASPVLLQLRLSASVSGSVGLVGVLLAAIGIYGITAYVVTRRTREIGIRIALGAERADVIAIVLRQGMSLVALGCVIGLLLAAGAGKLLARSLFGAPSIDLQIFAVATALFAVIGLAACYVPAHRATRIDAMEALRHE